VFPRAEFGLPIIFHFQGNEVSDTELDPFVNGERKERMGSPLILKPVMLQDGKTIVPVIMLLDGQRVDSVVLHKSGNNNPFPVRLINAAQYQNAPMQNRTNTGSALEAFLKYITESNQNYTEVQR